MYHSKYWAICQFTFTSSNNKSDCAIGWITLLISISCFEFLSCTNYNFICTIFKLRQGASMEHFVCRSVCRLVGTEKNWSLKLSHLHSSLKSFPCWAAVGRWPIADCWSVPTSLKDHKELVQIEGSKLDPLAGFWLILSHFKVVTSFYAAINIYAQNILN